MMIFFSFSFSFSGFCFFYQHLETYEKKNKAIIYICKMYRQKDFFLERSQEIYRPGKSKSFSPNTQVSGFIGWIGGRQYPGVREVQCPETRGPPDSGWYPCRQQAAQSSFLWVGKQAPISIQKLAIPLCPRVNRVPVYADTSLLRVADCLHA